MKRLLLVLAALLFWFGSTNAQTNFIHQDSIFGRTSDCALGVGVCIDSIAYDNINDLRFFVDGQQFSSQFTPCVVNTVHNYSYSDIFRGGERGPWRLDSWTVNGRTYTGTFSTLQTLLDSMRRWNPSGNWQLDNNLRIIYGFVAASTTYSCQEILGTQRGGQSQVCYNSGVEYRGLRFNVPVGIHQLIVEKVRTGERDTVTLLAACLKPETIRRTVAVGSNATYCASQSDLLGTLTTTKNICPKPATTITFGTPQTTCIRYTGTVIGTDTACIQVCDRYGFCDTTYLIVTAATRAGNSLTINDTISVGLSRTTCEVVLPAGTPASFTNICPQSSGSNVSFQLDPGTSCVTFRGLSVGTNTACIRACNVDGICDTTTINIQAIPYVAPRPTTRFTFSDTITVGLTRAKCSFNAPIGAITTFENICPSNSGTNASFTLDQATKCVTYRGVSIGMDTACIRVCNAAGQCDTTYMYIAAIVNGNGGGTNNGTGRTITVRDTISIGLSRENCGVSIPATVFSIINNCPNSSGTNVAFSIDPIRRCVSYRGLTVGQDTACYVVCNANGVCDTTIYIVGALDTASIGKTIIIRDTISVGTSRRDCRVSIPRGTYSGGVNLCPQSSGTNVSFVYTDATRCVDLRGLLVGSDTACIKICNTAGICDTTIYIITAVENTTGGGGNRCGLRVTPFVQVRSCGIKGFINLGVSGSTAPYTFRWADLTGSNQPQNRTELEAGNYTVTVSSATACDTVLTINVANNAINCGGGQGSNRCGLTVVPTAVSKTCTSNGAITLAVTGSISPYTFNWADLPATSDPKDRTNLEAGVYTVTVTPSTPNCDTVIAVLVANNATNCGGNGNRCGLVVVPTATPKTCTSNGSITLAVSGSTAPYTYDWTDLTGTTDPKDRTDLQPGTYTVKVVPSVSGCDTTLSVVILDNATNCGGGSNIRLANVTVQTQDSTTFCVDSSRVGTGFSVVFTSPQAFSVISETTPKGCFKIKGFIVGTDVATIILIGQNGVRDTTRLTINVVPRNNTGCGLVVIPTATPKTCATNGSITLAVSGSTAPYTYDWTDLTGTNDPKDRTNLQAGVYTVKVKSSVANCDTTLSITVTNTCVSNACGLVVVPTATPKTCTTNGSITLAVSGSTAPYTYDWTDLTGTTDPQNRLDLRAGSYTVKVSSSVANCDTTLTIVVANDSINCGGGSNIRFANVTVQTQDSTIFCVDSSRVGSGFLIAFSSTQINSIISETTPKGCFKIKGFVVGNDTALIILIGQNGVRDTTQLAIKVIPRNNGGNNCGLVINTTMTPKTCATGGSITLAVSGSTAPYTFDWTDLTGTTDPKDRTNLEAGVYTVKVTSSVANCDTTFSVTITNNCVSNRCGLLVVPTATPKTCTSNGSITLAVSGSTGPYTFDWTDLTGTTDPQNRPDLQMGIYTVKVTPSVAGCDTTLSIAVLNNATNCGGGIRFATVNVQVQDSTTFCVDTTRIGAGFTIALTGSQINSLISETTPRGCFKIRGFVVGQDSATIILVSPTGLRDTTKLTINVTPRTIGGGCGLVVRPTATPKNCTTNGSITLAVSGSVAPYFYDWTDLVGITDPKDRTNLPAGSYTVKVTSSALSCDTTLTIVVADNCVPNRCGLIVSPTVTPKTCTSNGTITLAVSGSTAPYTFDWSDIVGTLDSQNRVGLAAGTYIVKVTPAAAGCDTTVTITVGNEATNCGGNTCGLVVTPTAVPKTCRARGSITLSVSGGTAPYSYKWADLSATFPQNRTNLDAGVYTVTVTSSSPNCDTILRITIANDSTNCGSITFHKDSVTVFVQDSARYCADSSRVGSGFLVNIFTTTAPIYSVILPSTPPGCFTIRGFVPGRDTIFIILIGQNGQRDTTQLFVKVVPRPVYLPGRPDTITIKILESRIYCPDTSRLAGSPVNLIKFCSTDPFNNTSISLDTVNKCVVVNGISTGMDTFCIAVCNAAGFCDTTRLFVRVTPDTVRPVLRIDTVRLFVGDSLTYCNIDTGQIRGRVDTIYNICPTGSGTHATATLTPAKCLKINGLTVGLDSACIVVCDSARRFCDTTRVIIIVSLRPTTILNPREDSITIQVGEIRNYCPDTSRIGGGRVTSISFCSTATFDNSTILLIDSTKCARITGTVVGRDTACILVCNSNRVCDTVRLIVKVVPERPIKDTTIIVPVKLGMDSIFCNIDTTQLRGLLDTIYDACPGRNGVHARMVIDQVTHCITITGVNIGRDTMCVVVCNRSITPIRCDTTYVIAVVTDNVVGDTVVIANDDIYTMPRGTTQTFMVYDNDTIRPGRATLLEIVRPPVKGRADTVSFGNGFINYTASRSPSACGLDSFTYRVCINNICDTAQVVVVVECPDSLRTFTALSPNNDGVNDVFIIDGLQNYPENSVCIFNRWGNQVLNQKNYQNDWSGTWNGTNLPDGTYYYFVRDESTKVVLLMGYLQIVR